jgi:hypothetical protein
MWQWKKLLRANGGSAGGGDFNMTDLKNVNPPEGDRSKCFMVPSGAPCYAEDDEGALVSCEWTNAKSDAWCTKRKHKCNKKSVRNKCRLTCMTSPAPPPPEPEPTPSPEAEA